MFARVRGQYVNYEKLQNASQPSLRQFLDLCIGPWSSAVAQAHVLTWAGAYALRRVSAKVSHCRQIIKGQKVGEKRWRTFRITNYGMHEEINKKILTFYHFNYCLKEIL